MTALLERAAENHAILSMHAIDLGEVYYDCIRVDGERIADEMLDAIEALPLAVVWDIDKPMLKIAATMKTKHKMSYADCFAAALTVRQRSHLVSTDRKEFGPLAEANVIQVYWLR